MNRYFYVLIMIVFFIFSSAPEVTAATHSHGGKSSPAMIMHHMHIMLNHAVETAAEGSNLIMIGQMGMANGIDKTSIKHGLEMISDAEKVAIEVLSGDEMVRLHEQGVNPDNNKQMEYTHQLGMAALDYIDLLKKMYGSP